MWRLTPELWPAIGLMAMGAALMVGPSLAIGLGYLREFRRGRRAEAALRRYDPKLPCMKCRKTEHGRWYVMHYGHDSNTEARR